MLEVLGGPVALEGHPHPLDDVFRVDFRQPHVPLEAVEQGRVREVRGADERGAESGGPLEQPSLGVELGRARVEGDADLGTERDERVDRALLGRAHVGRRHDADAAAAGDDVRERVAQVADPRPDDERADQVD